MLVHVLVRSIVTGVAWFSDEDERDSFFEEAVNVTDEDYEGDIQALERDSGGDSKYGVYVPEELHPPRMNYLITGIGDEPGVRVADEWKFIIVETLERFHGIVTTTSREDEYDLNEWIEANAIDLWDEKPKRDEYEKETRYNGRKIDWWSECNAYFVNRMREELSLQEYSE